MCGQPFRCTPDLTCKGGITADAGKAQQFEQLTLKSFGVPAGILSCFLVGLRHVLDFLSFLYLIL
jgi:hypothetical protein